MRLDSEHRDPVGVLEQMLYLFRTVEQMPVPARCVNL
jgi:hypothetical protein